MDAQRKLYCAVSGLNLALLILVTSIPVWQYYYDPGSYFSEESYFILGLWAVCESNRCYPLYAIDAYMTTVRALVVISLIFSIIAFISSWELLERLTKKEMLEGMVSFGAHYFSGTCLAGALMITFVRPTVFGITGYFLLPHLGFYLGCVVCLMSLGLGTVRMLRYSPVNFAQDRTQIVPWICPLNFFRNIFYVVACVHFILVVFITASPFWVLITKDGQEVILGVWVICYQLRCIPNVNTRHMKTFQALMIGTCICLLMVLVPTRNILNRYRTRKIPESLFALAAEFLAGVFLLVPVVILNLIFNVINPELQTFPHWNYYIGCFCCALCFILGFLNVIWNAHVKERMTTAQVVPTSGIPPAAPGYGETPL